MEVSPSDKVLLTELRSKISAELELVPAYNDDMSLMRWLIGWERRVDVIVPKISAALKCIHALRLHEADFSSLEKVTEYCDAISEPLRWMPGSLIGFDRDGNVVALHTMGRLDFQGLFQCVRHSDLYRLNIADSEGVMSVIRAREKVLGRQLGTVLIFDLDGLTMGSVDVIGMKALTTMLGHLQVIWSMISPVLAKQTLQKISFLSGDWKKQLNEAIGPDVLFPHWGGSRISELGERGFVKMAGKVPVEKLRYNPADDLPTSTLKSLKVSARSTAFVTVNVTGSQPAGTRRRLRWWWRVDSGDVNFSVLRAAPGSETVAESTDDVVVHPKFRLQTTYVPEDGEIDADVPGVYKLVFDNTHSRLWSKTIRYLTEERLSSI